MEFTKSKLGGKLMKFNVELDLSDFFHEEENYFAESEFKTGLYNDIVEQIAINYINESGKQQVENLLKEYIQSHIKDIINKIIDKVSKDIEKKKELSELTPKAKDISEKDKENQAYFENLIDKAIAKKFK